MAMTHLNGDPVRTNGSLPAVGSKAPDFCLVRQDLSEISLSSFAGRRIVLNIFPSIDTGVCAMSVRRFNAEAAKLDNTTVLCVSLDLPFAAGRFCGAEGIENVVTASAFRDGFFAANYGVLLEDSPLKGLLARSVVVIDAAGKIAYTELVNEITTEPNYAAAIAAL